MKLLKLLTISTFFAASLLANDLELKYDGVAVKYTDGDDTTKQVNINRIEDITCKKINGADPKNVWGGNYANENLNPNCLKTFLTTAGKLTPMKMADGIDTYGEIEVIEFIKKSQEDDSYMLIDARTKPWYKKFTIPTAKNIPFPDFEPKAGAFQNVLLELGVDEDEGKYDFSEAKTLLLFCNGSWCPQSSWAINNLLSIGYPKEKLKWYRAGMYGWKIVNLTTIKPVVFD
jgi:rhodanese-related sulfurtransferase